MTVLSDNDMASQFWLYWSNIEAYGACPRSFLWGHGWEGIDLGRGPGRSKAKPTKDSRHDAIMGQVLSTAMERLYNDELWREPATLPKVLSELVDRELKLSLADTRTYIDWSRAPSQDEMLKICRDGILGYLRTMKANKLLGPYAKSEVDLTAWVDKYTPIAGRPDLILRRDDTGLTILDGKNSRNPGKYTNPDQLRWYALCFYLAYNTFPDKLVFCYYRYPEGINPPEHNPNTPWNGLVEVPCTRDDLKQLAVRAKNTYRAMGKGVFDPTPSPTTCRFCDYESVCDARIEQRQANAAKRAKGGKSSAQEIDVLGDSKGIVDIGFVPVSSLTAKK